MTKVHLTSKTRARFSEPVSASRNREAPQKPLSAQKGLLGHSWGALGGIFLIILEPFWDLWGWILDIWGSLWDILGDPTGALGTCKAFVAPKLAVRTSPECPFGAFRWPFVPQSPSQELQMAPKWCLLVSLWARFLVLVPLFLLFLFRPVKTCSQGGFGDEF